MPIYNKKWKDRPPFSFEFWIPYGGAAKTAAGFFWKSGWAFVLGYFISAMIQVFVP